MNQSASSISNIPTPSRYQDAKAASGYLGEKPDPRTLTKWAREHKIPAYPMGDGARRTWLFSPSDLDAWLEERKSAYAHSAAA